MRLKKYQYNSKSFVTIVDDRDCPIDPYVSCYISSIAANAPNTVIRYVNELLFLLRYFGKNNISITERFSSGEFISFSEYGAFYNASFLLHEKELECYPIKFISVDDKYIRNIMVANKIKSSMVSNETAKGRIRRLRLFFDWLYAKFHLDYKVSEIVSDNFKKLIAKIEYDEKCIGNNRAKSVASLEDSVIPNDVFKNLLEIIKPSSDRNPFKGSRVRNYLIVSILIQGGIRVGALAKIKISDCHFYDSYDRISIYPNQDDPTDIRLDKPNQKTKSHLVTLDPKLMHFIKFYIDNIRCGFNKSQNHDFIFISEKDSQGSAGEPLSLKGIRAIFNKLSDELGFYIYPHLLRHKWNEIFDIECEQQGIDARLSEDIRKYAMGWVQNTSMEQIYNDKRLAEKARRLSKAYQARVDKL